MRCSGEPQCRHFEAKPRNPTRSDVLRPLSVALAVFGLLARPSCAEQVREAPLAALVEEFERSEQEVESARSALAAPGLPGPERGRLQERIGQLQARQAELIDQIERAAGSLAPSVRPEKPSPAEERMETRRQRDDAVLEKDVERRLR